MRTLFFSLATVLCVGCKAPAATDATPAAEANADDANAKAEPSADAKAQTPDAKAAPSDDDAKAAAADGFKPDPKFDPHFKVDPLTEEEKDLLARDPSSLSPEDRTKWSHAQRKKILNNPDSPQAKSIREHAENILSGEVQPNLDYKEDRKAAQAAGGEQAAPAAAGE